jgi:hypothetical protein
LILIKAALLTEKPEGLFCLIIGLQHVKQALEALSETSAAAAAILWFMSARVRMKKRGIIGNGLSSGIDDPKALLLLVYQQSRWNAWAAIAAGFAALFAMADGWLAGH